MIDLYSDYLICSSSATTSTGLSRVVDGKVSHDQVTRFLSSRDFDSRDLWLSVKKHIRQIESPDGVLIIDDTIEHKPHTDVNDIVCYHFDHTSGRNVKGINIVNCLYNVGDISLPVAFEIVEKPIQFCDLKTKKEKRKSVISKNELMRNMLAVATHNSVSFSYVLADIWYSSSENMKYIACTLKKEFMMPVKSNRLVALSKKDWINKNFLHIDDLPWQEEPLIIWMKGIKFPLFVHKQVFTNKDGSKGVLYLTCSDLNCTKDDIEKIYQKRWNVESFHKTLKQNASLAKSPTKRVRTQANHICMAMLATVKLEVLKMKEHSSHFAIKMKLYTNAVKTALSELQKMKQHDINILGA